MNALFGINGLPCFLEKQSARFLASCCGKKLVTNGNQFTRRKFLVEKLYKVPVRFVGKSSASQNFDNDDFIQLYMLDMAEQKQIKALKIISRYQIAAMSVLLPLSLAATVEGAMSWAAGGSTATIGILTVIASVYLILSKRNCVYSLSINDKITHVKIDYLTNFGRGKEIVAPVAFSKFADDPELILEKDVAKLVFNSSCKSYTLPYKGGNLMNEKLFIQAFGPSVLADFRGKINM